MKYLSLIAREKNHEFHQNVAKINKNLPISHKIKLQSSLIVFKKKLVIYQSIAGKGGIITFVNRTQKNKVKIASWSQKIITKLISWSQNENRKNFQPITGKNAEICQSLIGKHHRIYKSITRKYCKILQSFAKKKYKIFWTQGKKILNFVSML